jgi:hypothetical protein
MERHWTRRQTGGAMLLNENMNSEPSKAASRSCSSAWLPGRFGKVEETVGGSVVEFGLCRWWGVLICDVLWCWRNRPGVGMDGNGDGSQYRRCGATASETLVTWGWCASWVNTVSSDIDSQIMLVQISPSKSLLRLLLSVMKRVKGFLDIHFVFRVPCKDVFWRKSLIWTDPALMSFPSAAQSYFASLSSLSSLHASASVSVVWTLAVLLCSESFFFPFLSLLSVVRTRWPARWGMTCGGDWDCGLWTRPVYIHSLSGVQSFWMCWFWYGKDCVGGEVIIIHSRPTNG